MRSASVPCYRKTETTPMLNPKAILRFWSKVRFSSRGCWLWQGGKSDNGYGSFWHGHRNWRTHRVSWQLAYGSTPKSALVCHHCDVKLCVRPDHLFLGDHFTNQQDSYLKGRSTFKLDAAAVRKIRQLLGLGKSQSAIARKFGVTRTCIWDALHGRTWRHGV